jgi:hypothetical protein
LLAHDPRASNDRKVKIETFNLALIDAELKIRDGDEVDWNIVASLADHCDNVAGTSRDRAKRGFSLRSLFGLRPVR